MDLRALVRDIPDFPKPGILFKDVMPVLTNQQAFKFVIGRMADQWDGQIDAIAALEARGFLFGTPLAVELGVPFVPVRKKGKLPGEVVSQTYALEYGTDTVEVQKGAFAPGANVLIVDDLLATGGTAAAAGSLVEKGGGKLAGFSFVIELCELGGRSKLPALVPVQSLIEYAAPDLAVEAA